MLGRAERSVFESHDPAVAQAVEFGQERADRLATGPWLMAARSVSDLHVVDERRVAVKSVNRIVARHSDVVLVELQTNRWAAGGDDPARLPDQSCRPHSLACQPS